MFDVMSCAYRNGVLEKFTIIQGEALEEVIKQSGWNLGDLLNRLDETEEKTVKRIDRLLDRMGPLARFLNNDRLMKLSSRLLDAKMVRKMAIATMKTAILKTLPGQAPPSIAERIKSLAGRAA
jgi:hypothetical protein